jgi:hypothetical protein
MQILKQAEGRLSCCGVMAGAWYEQCAFLQMVQENQSLKKMYAEMSLRNGLL